MILIILDALNWNAWMKTSPKNIPKLLGSKAVKAHSSACHTLPALISYLNNYPPIGIGLGLFDKGRWFKVDNKRQSHINTRAWMPDYYQKKGYHTSLFTGNAVMAEADREICLSRNFDHWGVMEYLKEDVHKATPRIIEDFTALCLEVKQPIFSVLWLFDTHYPFSNSEEVFGPHFNDGYATMMSCIKALKYTDEEVFPAIVDALRSTGRTSKVILTSDHGENHGGDGAGHNPFSSKLRMSDDLFSIPYIEGVIEP